jgi:hypothetical protein
LHDITKELNVSLADLLVTGALSLASRVQTQAGFLRAKADEIASSEESF